MDEKTVTTKVSRKVRIPLDGSRTVMGLNLTHMDVMHVEFPDGCTSTVTRNVRAEGSYDPETDPVGPAFHFTSLQTVDETVAREIRKEGKLGTLAGEPRELITDGDLVAEEIPRVLWTVVKGRSKAST